MLFNSLPFLYAFLPVSSLVYWRLTSARQRYVWLSLSGYAFYSFWNYKFCTLMLLSTSISYLAGLGLMRWQDPSRRRLCLVVPVTLDLLLLAIFKYAGFAIEGANQASAWLGAGWELPSLEVVLPVGISFYTFHTITYVVDAYRGAITPTRSFAQFASYVSLFPQLVAGPITRFRQIERDLENVGQAERVADMNTGWSFFVIGMAKKVLLADPLGELIAPALGQHAALSSPGAWLCLLGFAYQVYYDFSGYSDMAVGLGHMLGLRLPQNFNSPYRAADTADFWRRWHVSMSSFFRDYVFLPLGGARGSRLALYRNLMLTMLLVGLWHGAAWTFVLWGAYCGLLLALHHAVAGPWARLPLPLQRAGTFLLFVVGLAFFRAESVPMALDLLAALFSWRPGILPVGTETLAALVLAGGAAAHFGPNTFEMRHRWSPAGVAGLAGLFCLCLFFLYGTASAPFLYFQF
ncbi:MAG: MBOAT family protein [Vicinamibacteria bacterium]